MNACPECNNRLYEYKDGVWLEWICWICGHYESNTPAFKACPYLFKDLLRNNPIRFLEKYAHYKPQTEFQQRNKTTEDPTEPVFCKTIARL